MGPSVRPREEGASLDEFGPWPRCPAAAAFFEDELQRIVRTHPPLQEMQERFLREAGVRLANLVDHLVLPRSLESVERLERCGLVETLTDDGDPVWEHPAARLPRVRLSSSLVLAIAVEDLESFLGANDLQPVSRAGDTGSAYEEAVVPSGVANLAVVVRRGYRGFRPGTMTPEPAAWIERARQAFRTRRREGADREVTDEAMRLATAAVEELGPGRAAEEFFAAEREYYLTRNRAAAWQYNRQAKLGLGWANHDHHTYRSSREGFRSLMRLWRLLGFEAREKLYAGAEAGWGAQILEHPSSRVVLFSDVDLAPEEIAIDCFTEDLPPRRDLATIGLWCALHGSSIALAGMHHLEAEYDFGTAENLFRANGFGVMKPFTDLPMLKQAFTEPEIWRVEGGRVDHLEREGRISAEQANLFRARGAAGSHLEILQRWEGFKGFNKTGVSSIIRETDARRVVERDA